MDGLVTHFVDEAANPRTLAALSAGGLAYRFGRIGILGLGVRGSGFGLTWLRPLSVAVGLGSEVTAFEFTNRAFQSFTPNPELRTPNLWSFSGPGGWREGLATSAITFGMLKGAGFLAREQNIVLQHAFQSSAMVAGHSSTGLLGITPRPEGTLAEQFFHAEATNIQLAAGTSLVHSAAPGFHALERSLDLSLSTRPSMARNPHGFSLLQEAITGGPRQRPPSGQSLERPLPRMDIMMMSSGKPPREGNGNGNGDPDPTPPAHPPSRRTSLPNILEGIAKISSREGAKEALAQLAAGLTGPLQRRVFAALNDLEAGLPINPIIRRILEDPKLQRAAFLSPAAKEQIKIRIQAIQEGETVHSTHPPSPMVGGWPSPIGFKRIAQEHGISYDDLAKILNHVFAPQIDLSRYTSYEKPIFIAQEDEAKLTAYAKLNFQSIGEVVFFARKDLSRNWTVQDAARHLRMEPQEWEAIENNEQIPSQKHMERMARSFGLHIGYLKEVVSQTSQHFPALSPVPSPTSEVGTSDPSELDPRPATGEAPTTAPHSMPPDVEKLEQIYQQRLTYLEEATSTPVGTWPIEAEDGLLEMRGIARFFVDRNKRLKSQIDIDERTGVLSINGLKRMTPKLEGHLLLPSRRQSDGPRKSDWVLMLDLDFFRKINEDITHPNANIVLRTVAQIMTESVRFRDIVARYGGEEFFVWLSNSDREGAIRVAEAIRAAVEQHTYQIPGYIPFNATLSIGVAEMRLLPNPEEGGDPVHEGALQDAIIRADRALFISKRDGRNRWTLSDE